MSQNQPVKKQTDLKLIALAIVCVILGAGFIAAILVGQPSGASASDLQAQISQKDSTISSLQSQVSQLQSQLAQSSGSSTTDSQVASLQQQIQDLTDQINSYNNILYLNATSTLAQQQGIQDANASTVVFDDYISYAGYVAVQTTATDNSTYVQVVYTFGNTVFNYNQTVGTAGTAHFAVLPGQLQISIGNVNEEAANNVTATAIYYY